ncbi:MAG: hypothetical protein J1F39_07055 [Clostridiales bacterium]|nr:hypothetical protein [Clostridiales bacterium]
MRKAIKGFESIDDDLLPDTTDIVDKLKSLYEIIGFCSDGIYRVRYPLAEGMPRLYRICAEIAESSAGELSIKRLNNFTAAINSSELSNIEKRSFGYLLAICYADIAARTALNALKVINKYLRGRNDGIARKVDLLSIQIGAYSAGVTKVIGDDEKNEYFNLAASNGIDLSAVIDRFFLELSFSVSDFICACRSAQTITDVEYKAENTPLRAFGGETEYKSNVMGGAVTVQSDNRGRVEIIALGKTIPIEIKCESGEDKISLCSCDGVMTGGRTVYHGARKGVEFNAQLTSPPDACAAVFRLSAVNRTNRLITVNLFAGLGVDGKTIAAGINHAVINLDGEYIGFYTDGEFSAVGNIYNFYLELLPFEKRTVNFSVVFGSRYALPSKGALSLSGGYFERANIVCTLYRHLNGSFVCEKTDGNGILDGVEYYTPNKIGSLDAFSDADIMYGSTGKVYRAKSGCLLVNTATDGVYRLSCRSDGESVSKISGKVIARNAVVLLEEDGRVFSPSAYPCGAGKAHVELKNGSTAYKTLYKGLDCTLERFISDGNKAERFIVTVVNKINRPRTVYAMLSVNADGKCVRTDNGVTAESVGGGYITAVTSSEHEYAFFSEGYIKHGATDRAHGFRNGGISSAPTVSVKLTVPPRGTGKVDFALIYSEAPPDKALIQSVLSSRRQNGEYIRSGGIYIEPKTSNDTLNFVYSRARYLVDSGLCGDAELVTADSHVTELLKISRSLYSEEKFDSALRALLSAINTADEEALLFLDGAESIAAARLIYKLVTENLFGLTLCGDTAYIYPQINSCPFSVGYEIKSDYGTTVVTIDNSERVGEWVIKQGIVTRSCGGVKLEDGNITVMRDGKTRRALFPSSERAM